jgi:sugar/nucleoside kinase (ribokinase family)
MTNIDTYHPRLLIAGQLTQDFIIPPVGKPLIDVPGGNLVYAAAGLATWGGQAGLLARVGNNYPKAWIKDLLQRGFETRGINVLPESLDLRQFTAYADMKTRVHENPIKHFSHIGLPFPKALFGYVYNDLIPSSRTQLLPVAIRPGDIPEDYLEAKAAHICPMDYLDHKLLPSLLRSGYVTTITLDPSDGYMIPSFWDDFPHVISGIDAFITSERKLRSLFQNRSEDLWEMAEAVGSFGCEFVIIRCQERGQLVYDAVSKSRWLVPAYPARVIDPTGGGDAFCGGFLIGYQKTFDPLHGTLYGNISASLTIEGSKAFYALDALSGLAEARYQSLQGMVQRI